MLLLFKKYSIYLNISNIDKDNIICYCKDNIYNISIDYAIKNCLIIKNTPFSMGSVIKDRISGMFMGVFLGDALGAPHEFYRYCKDVKYTGNLEHKTFTYQQFQGKKELQIGQVTDDSEMTLTLLRQLIEDNGFIRENVLLAYIEWVNSGGWMIGSNTRKMLKGYKTLKTHEKRIQELLNIPESERSQSNGPLMRATPLVLLNKNVKIEEDAHLTNIHPVVDDSVNLYVSILRKLISRPSNMLPDNIFTSLENEIKTEEVKYVYNQVKNGIKRDIVDKKGWILHALWCSLWILKYHSVPSDKGESFENGMKWLIESQPGSDTDTNAAIAGAVLGAIIGLNEMKLEKKTKKNIDIVLNADINNGPTPRPEKYSPHDFYELMNEAYKLYNKQNTTVKNKKIIIKKK
jgi:ADP-ribosylglycohydrolase